jgi:hypothetical protein
LTTVPPQSTDPSRRDWTEGIQPPPVPPRCASADQVPRPAVTSKPSQARLGPSEPSEAGARGHSRGAITAGRPRLDRRRHTVLAAELRSTMPPSHQSTTGHTSSPLGEKMPLEGKPRPRHHHQGFALRSTGRRREDDNVGWWLRQAANSPPPPTPPESPRVRRRGGSTLVNLILKGRNHT